MNKRCIVILLVTMPWGLLLWLGLSAVASIEAQHAPDYPSTGQIGYYIGVPTMACLAGLAGAALGFKCKSPVTLVTGFLLAAALVPYILPYGGGV